MTGTTNNGAPPSEAWKQFVDSAQALLTGIQRGGAYNVVFDPYLQDISVEPVAPPQTINTWLLIGGGILLVLLLWR